MHFSHVREASPNYDKVTDTITFTDDITLKDKNNVSIARLKGVEFTNGKLTAINIDSDWVIVATPLSAIRALSSHKDKWFQIPEW